MRTFTTTRPQPYYTLDKVLEVFKRNNITGILATSRPNIGTNILVDAKPGVGRSVHSAISRARGYSDLAQNATIWILSKRNGAIIGASASFIFTARRPGTKSPSRSSVLPSLTIYICMLTATMRRSEILFSHDPRAKIIWAHTGFGVARVEDCSEKALSSTLGRTILSERDYRIGRKDQRRLGAIVRAPLRTFSARFGYMDQRALGQLRRHHERISRLACAAAYGSSGANSV